MASKSSLWNRLRSLVRHEATSDAAIPAVEPIKVAPTGESKPEHEIDLIIGFDFGTSCSKVVIGDPGWQAQSFAVNFRTPGGELNDWLLPTRLRNERNLKMRLMDEPDSEGVQDLVAIYFAGVIRRSQQWFQQHAPAGYQRKKVLWSVVIGFPEKEFSSSPLSIAYEKVASLAARLCGGEDELTPETVQLVRRSDGFDSEIPPSRIHFYPEIAAQLAGYINSPFRQNGNLLLIDVGAGTLDVSTLIVHGNRERDVVSFHICDVRSLGVLRLLESRIAALREVPGANLKVELLEFQDTLRPSPERITDLVSRPTVQARRSFDEATKRFAEEVVRSPLACLARFRKIQRDCHANRNFDPWGSNLRFFLTGGGSRSGFYRHHLTDGPLEQELAPFTRWHREPERRRRDHQGFRVERLPVPEKLLNFPGRLHGEFDRLSVAHGLAFGGPNLMKITRSSLS